MRALTDGRRDPAPRYLATFVVAGASFTLAGPSLVLLKRQVDVDTGAIGIVFSAVGLGYLVSSLAAARGYDRGWGNRLVGGALIVLAAAMLGVPAAGSLAVLAALFFFIGASIAAVDVGANTLMVWRSSTGSAPWLAALHFCFGAGALLIPLVVRLSQTQRDDVALACWLIAGGAVVAGIAVARARSPRRPATRELEPHPDRASPPSYRRLLVALVLFFYVYVGVEGGFAAWIYTYATEIDLGAAAATAITTTFWACFTVGRLVSIGLARFVGSFRLVAAASLLAVAALSVMVLGGGSPAVVWGCTAVVGFAVAPQFPLMISFAGRHMELAAATTGWFVATAGVANLTLPWCIGQLIDRHGADAMPKATFACSVAVLLALWRVARVARLRPPVRFGREAEPATPIASA